jgi:hypothetical protein
MQTDPEWEPYNLARTPPIAIIHKVPVMSVSVLHRVHLLARVT